MRQIRLWATDAGEATTKSRRKSACQGRSGGKPQPDSFVTVQAPSDTVSGQQRKEHLFFCQLTVSEAVVAPAGRVIIKAIGGGRTGPPVALEPLRVTEAIPISAKAAIVPICQGREGNLSSQGGEQPSVANRARAQPSLPEFTSLYQQ